MKTHVLHKDRILVPVDLNPNTSEVALRAAAELARTPEALHVLHVVEPSAWEMPTALVTFEGEEMSLTKYLRVRAKRDLDALIDRTLGDSGKGVRRTVEWGHVTSTLCGLLEREAQDLIVLATHGRTGIDRFLHGSVAERIIRLASCPVLVVRATTNEENAAVPTLRGS